MIFFVCALALCAVCLCEVKAPYMPPHMELTFCQAPAVVVVVAAAI